jgi:demethylmenaquinone methyltransferase/2-methoxy-6-polyprenyl-1,4-benzoquinol methylase
MTTPAAAAGNVGGRIANIQACQLNAVCSDNEMLHMVKSIPGSITYNGSHSFRRDMTQLTGNERAKYVQRMFTRIARRYDFMNRLMTGGQDIRWRKQVIRLARIDNNASLLDLGTGTGDLAREALSQFPRAKVIAADFTLEMMRVGQKTGLLNFSAADALRLPFGDSSFDSVVSGFLLRNVIDLDQALEEQVRVLKNGGRVVILDTTRPQKNILSPLIWFHLHFIIPALGGLLTGSRDAYRYLPETTEGFVTAEELAARMANVGFRKIGYQRFMLGTIAIHWGEK